ncbi:hypothetical protein TNCV_4495051 [Trichonephila clavipes]|nr:hypothetical protein TNCV_4495051 [Trichonephila clavipes]
MSTFNIPILPFFVHIFLKTTQLSCRRKQFNSPLNSKTKTIAGEKQLNSATGTKQLNSTGENNSTGRMNETTQQEKTTQFGSRNEPTRLCPACTAFTAESPFLIYS